jgi:hypothetical protein
VSYFIPPLWTLFVVAKKQESPDLNMYSYRRIYQQITSCNVLLFINISSIHFTIREFDIYIYIYICVCVCERERERERDLLITLVISQQLFDTLCVILMAGLISYSELSKVKLRIINFQKYLTLILLTWRIWWAPNNTNRWQMGFNSEFKGLNNIFTTILCKSFIYEPSTLFSF